MNRKWYNLAIVVVAAVVGAGCEVEPPTEAAVGVPIVEDAGEVDDTPAPLPAPVPAPVPAPLPAPVGTESSALTPQPAELIGVERNVAPLPSTPPTATPSGLQLLAVTADADEPFTLDGAAVVDSFAARLEVDDDRIVERVVWELNGDMFRDDDLKEPYTLRYASDEFPLDEWVESDQGLPGRFRAATGSTVELTATVISADGADEVTATFAVVADPARAPSTSVPAETGKPDTTPPSPSTTVTSLPPETPAPSTTTSPPAPTTLPPVDPAPPSTGGVPWTIPDGATVSVTLPEGHLGPRTTTPVDPASVSGISFGGGVWTMGRDWDETLDGGYLDFGAAALRPNGHQVLGFRIEVPANVAGGHLIDGGGEVGWFEVSNPQQFSHNSFIRHEMHAHHYIARGVVGDAIKVGLGSAFHHDAYIEMDVRPGGSTDKHYDGVQVFNQGTLRLERVVIEWADAGVTANTTGALFTQTNAALFARDLLVLNPGGTWQPVRLSGSGDHDVDRVQLIGERRPNNNSPGKLAPTAAVKVTNGSGTFTVWNGVAGADDWLIE